MSHRRSAKSKESSQCGSTSLKTPDSSERKIKSLYLRSPTSILTQSILPSSLTYSLLKDVSQWLTHLPCYLSHCIHRWNQAEFQTHVGLFCGILLAWWKAAGHTIQCNSRGRGWQGKRHRRNAIDMIPVSHPSSLQNAQPDQMLPLQDAAMHSIAIGFLQTFLKRMGFFPVQVTKKQNPVSRWTLGSLLKNMQLWCNPCLWDSFLKKEWQCLSWHYPRKNFFCHM